MADVNLLHATGTETRLGRAYTRVYQVISTSADPNIIMQVQGDGLPGFGNAYPTDPYSVVVSINPQRYESVNDGGTTKYKWTVEVRYAPRHSNAAATADPTDEKPVMRVGSVVRETVLERDINDDAVVNSANDPFDPPLMEEEHDDLLSVTVNIKEPVIIPAGPAEFDITGTMAYKDTYNNAEITVCDYVIPQYAGLMRDIQCQPLSRNGVDYWAVTYEIQITRRNGLWRYERPLDAGYQYLDGSDSDRKKPIEHDAGQATKGPAKLDGSGHLLAEGANSVYLEIPAKSGAAWSGLSLPASTF